ncbi:lytic polysaccharide monooxygenase [Paenibacillus sp. FJAT-26967]|uniref:lytic polysaccharide monooxygenase n=1 Tax=Paenibacillus sp. FJAT-26967 TaxID=1729690 RepID=UPI0008397A28|nr:lytic polysaccharide monooxygenase [Paenibacillus sp. FJAT-26967]
MNLALPNHTLLHKLVAACGMLLMIAVLMLLFPNTSSAHGYLDVPASRALLCKTKVNTDCGGAAYEPQSAEAGKGFPNGGPGDGHIASAGNTFPKLDEQTSTRWSKVPMTAGPQAFKWQLNAAHATTTFKYFITKPGWNPNAPLTRASFDLTPFCQEDFNGASPANYHTTNCNVPERTGYHVILAIWEVSGAPTAYVNVTDVDFGGGSTLPAPTNLASAAVTDNSVSLNWSAVAGASSYQVYRNNVAVGTTSSTSFTSTGLSSGTTYSFTVAAIDSSGKASAASSVLAVKTTGSGGAGTYAAWSASTVYVGGNKVSYNGVNYEAKWWTLGETPTGTNVWKVIP